MFMFTFALLFFNCLFIKKILVYCKRGVYIAVLKKRCVVFAYSSAFFGMVQLFTFLLHLLQQTIKD